MSIGVRCTPCDTGCVGIYEKSNDNGMRIKEFSLSRNMIISSTRFPHKDIHKETCIIGVRFCGAADCDSDHHLFKLGVVSCQLRVEFCTGGCEDRT
jgi:hypothetical protein